MSQPDKNLIVPDLKPLPTVTESVEIPQQIGFFIELVSAFQENQKLLLDNQRKILKGLALINTKIEELATRSQGIQQEQQLSIICHKSGINNAYALVDTMFDRQFMKRCSWGEGSKGEPKHCFKAFPKTIALSLKVVHKYDKTFSNTICEEFFSTQRNTATRERNSTTKKKTKKTEANNKLPEEIPGLSSASEPNQ
ncbi:uncharacterized protein LOC124541488 [Vanessa cardui]|uniref:uncharacterized protein LOC124541488 n=1 Tax=Vanessa cardui TaxID=171605 RepID=UPI001F12A4F2|nr:uncharacterized protein LOC124541488 [Vanessa cardui]